MVQPPLMSTGTGSDSGFDFQLVPLHEATSSDRPAPTPESSIPFLDLESVEPLPELTESHGVSMPKRGGGGASAGGRIESADGLMWLEGDVLMCGCPDCRAPMTIRLWLMIADCWKCGTSIELTEQQEREAKRLLKKRGASAQTSSTISAATSRPERAAQSRSPERDKEATTDSPKPARPTPPLRPPVQKRNRLSTGKRVAASENLARRRFQRKRSAARWLAALFHDTPAWLVSLVFHVILLTLLALLTLPVEDNANYIVLNTVVSKDYRRSGQETIETPADRLKYDPLVPPELDLEDPATRETVLRADQDARELRLVDEANPYLPDLARVKRQIASAEGARVAVAARDPRVRTQVLQQEGGTTLTEAAVARGLRWLARQQQPDGRWQLDAGNRSDTAATSLSLMPFLGAGQTQIAGRYKAEVAKGLRWLVDQQRDDGDLRGNSRGNTGMYAHGQSAIVLCEAYLMTGDETLREAAQKATDFIVQAQYADGGWRYKPRKETGSRERGDTSVVGWQLMALQSARAANLEVPVETFELANHFLDSVQSHEGARYAYQSGSSATHPMTAEALLCRIYLGWTKEDPALLEGATFLAANHLPDRGQPNMYYWYYATQTFHHIGGAMWDRWNFHMRDVLVNAQEKGGRNAGSWTARGQHDRGGGRVYMTALAVCTLEVYYRHLPIFRQIDVE